MPSDDILNRALVAVYLVMVGLVVGERLSGSGVANIARSFIGRQKRAWADEGELRRSFIRMAYEVWELTGQRVDRA